MLKASTYFQLIRNLQPPLSSDESKYCQVSMTGRAGLEFSFTLR